MDPPGAIVGITDGPARAKEHRKNHHCLIKLTQI